MFRTRSARPGRSAGQRRSRFRRLAVALSLLASPVAAATIVVDQTIIVDFDDPFCSLSEAILAANLDVAYHGCEAGSGFDRIEFDLPPGSTILGNAAGLPTVIGSLQIAGPGAEELTIDGADLQPLFLVDSPGGGAALEIADLTLTGGNAFTVAFSRGGAVTVREGDLGVFRRVVFRDNFSDLGGGAILLLGALGAPASATIDRCTFEDNEGGVFGGGAILGDTAILSIGRSTFVGNTTAAEPSGGQAFGGGALHLRDSATTVRTSTFTGNSTAGSGGAILIASPESAVPDSTVITDSTIVDNVGDADGDDLGAVGGVALSAFPGDAFDVVLQNDLIALNEDPGAVSRPDILISGAGITTLGFNLVGDNTGMTTWFPTGNPNANFDYAGTAAQPLVPALSALGDFGGPTPVRLPVPGPGSLVIDRGRCALADADQRGFVDAGTGLRAVDDPVNPPPAGGDHCDVGAAEAGAVEPPTEDLPFLDGFEDGTTTRWSSSVGG